MKDEKRPARDRHPLKELRDAYNKVAATTKPRPTDIEHLREVITRTPASWQWACTNVAMLRQQLVERISKGTACACLLAELDVWRKQLEYDTSPALERLLIDLILTAHLRVIDAENRCTLNMQDGDGGHGSAAYWEGILSSSHSRLIRAIESLARVRRLARNSPALQINIAREGGTQVNMQGNMDGNAGER